MDNLLDKLEEYAEVNAHGVIDWESDVIVLINHSDGAGDHIHVWAAPWPQPSDAELDALDAAAVVRKNKKAGIRLTWLIVRENIAAQASVPLAKVTRELVSEKYEEWSADMTDPDLTQGQRDTATTRVNWLNAQNQKRRAVNKKIMDGTYTTENDVRNAAEW